MSLKYDSFEMGSVPALASTRVNHAANSDSVTRSLSFALTLSFNSHDFPLLSLAHDGLKQIV